ncbi:MAG: GNAT family N-acetyltransferase [Xanthobacteraceae bacterium]|nr:MAG: GNAT family N-acetyltransferase [Xanthobacteraceae bacterium]
MLELQKVPFHVAFLDAQQVDGYAAHLARLEPAARVLRFHGQPPHRLTDDFIAAHASDALGGGAVVAGYYDGLVLRGVGEMRIHAGDPATADVALSVEREWRGRKIGEELMGALILEARYLGIRRIVVACLRDNLVMQRLVTRFAGDLRRHNGTVLGIIERHRDLVRAA